MFTFSSGCDFFDTFAQCFTAGMGPFFRRFYTYEERIAHLEKYKEFLEKELKGVQETIEELKQKGAGAKA